MNCYVVKDLLPNYIDELVSEETEKDITEHLKNCPKCQILYEQMKAPIAPVPIKTDGKEINFLKKIKAKTIRSIAIGVAAIIIVFGVLTWIFAIGSPAKSSDVSVETNHLGQDWVIHFELTNGKALSVRSEFTYGENESGDKIVTGLILKPYAIQPSKFLFECDNFTTGYMGTEHPTSDFTVTVRYKDKDVVYSMTDEGLFELE